VVKTKAPRLGKGIMRGLLLSQTNKIKAMANIQILKYITYRRKSFFDYACNFFQNSPKSLADKQTRVSQMRTCRRIFGDLSFYQINIAHLTALNEMLIVQGYSDSYIKSIFSSLKIAINTAVNGGLLYKNPTASITIKRGIRGKEIQGIAWKSLRVIEKTKYRTQSLRFVAKLFSFQCRTGLSYVDLVTLKYGEISRKNGRYWLMGERRKTSKRYIIPLDDVCLKIINEFRKPLKKISFKKRFNDDVFPFIRRGTYNAYLKMIGEISGIKEAKTLSSHKARHTFAERMLEKGVSVESIRKMLGHSPRSQVTWLYVKATFEKLSKEVKNNC
jgi:integrase